MTYDDNEDSENRIVAQGFDSPPTSEEILRARIIGAASDLNTLAQREATREVLLEKATEVLALAWRL